MSRRCLARSGQLTSEADRRRYLRVVAPIVFAPMGAGIFHHRRGTTDVSQGGMRAFSDARVSVGQRLELELWLPDQSSLKCWVRVAWVDELPLDAAARFDVGFQFLDLADPDFQRLASVLSAT